MNGGFFSKIFFLTENMTPAKKGIEATAFDLVRRFVGASEVAGSAANPQILAMLRLDEK